MADNSKSAEAEVKISPSKDKELKKRIKNITGLKEEAKKASAKNVSELLEIILAGASNLGSSDIHLETGETAVKIRIRIDGLLKEVTEIDSSLYKNLLSRIKLISGLKLNISDRPQDGRFTVLESSLPIEIRVSSLPSEYGESLVLRILNPKSLIDLESLGLRPDLFSIFKREIKKPNGMIIITGPTGSGKTTTLYAFLKKIQVPEVKIITIEDPIEYHLKGISQTQVNPQKGYDFASGLQSMMRQDPDVILVGEIRDSKTCQIALQAALTGHLVFTTLHTNDAAGTVARLVSLQGDIKNIGPAVNMAVAQRLVRKICPKCSKSKTISPKDLAKIKTGLKGLPKEVKIPKLTGNLKLPSIKGCQACNSMGYQGRVGIFETILMTESMEKFILKNPSIASFREEAIKKGMVTMYQDGLIKVIQGETTIEEVERAAGEK